jgi:hypothetical protein
MKPHTHLIAGIFLALFLFELGFLSFGYSVLLVVLTVLIDLDHLINFIHRTKKFSFDLLWKDLNNPKHLKKTWFHFKKGRVLVVLLLVLILQLDFSLGITIFSAYFLHVFIDDFADLFYKKSSKKSNKLINIVELVMNCFFIMGIIILL